MRLFIIIFFSTAIMLLSGLSFRNQEIEVINDDGLSRISLTDGITIYDYAKSGTPAIPLKTYYFSIPNGKTLDNVIVKANNIKVIELDFPLMQAPLPTIYSNNGSLPSALKFEGNYSTVLLNSSTNQTGPYRFGAITVSCAAYQSETNRILVPAEFEIEYTLKNGRYINNPSTVSSEIIANELGLNNSRVNDEAVVLYVGTDQIINAMNSLFDFRRKQGYIVRYKLIEDIINTYSGIDNAEKLKNAIIDEYQNHNVSYITLLGNADLIPIRYTWAFDCEYGLSEDENNIPSDMYFACLDNNWDSNGNGIYGEDSDAPDRYPEVFVSRISLSGPEQVSDYANKLIDYEKGVEFGERGYNHSFGISTNLWEYSNSVLAQEYIESHYFPEYYSNNIYNEEDNTLYNFNNEIMLKPNIIQHTGHAFHHIMALNGEYLSLEYAESLNHEATTGIMYSIGCWAGALDYESIAEAFSLNAPVLGFICNSRYGWGAPSADGFGFSEYFQKEFFKLLFSNRTLNLAELNSLQKLPFIPYMNGDSVYKWVAYEMNSLGDSMFMPYRNNPLPMQLDFVNENSDMYITTRHNNRGVGSVLITDVSGNQYYTNDAGTVLLGSEAIPPFTAYKYGYEFAESSPQSFDEGLSIIHTIIEPQDNNTICVQNSNYSIDFTMHSELSYPQSYYVEYVPDNPEFFGMTEQFVSGTINPGETVNIDGYGFIIEPTDEVAQLANGVELGMTINVYDIQDNVTPLTSTKVNLPIHAPVIDIDEIHSSTIPIPYEEEQSLSITLSNIGDFEIEAPLTVTLSSDLMENNAVIDIQSSLTVNDDYSLEIPYSISEHNSQNVEFVITLQYTFNNQIMFKKYSCVYPTESSSNDSPLWETDFEDPFNNILPFPWQREFKDDSYVLTCRPSNSGNYRYELPEMLWNRGLVFNFDYMYRMPMYGEDGVSVIVSNEETEEEILFVGSGGALSRDNGMIYSDWAEYNLQLNELISFSIEDNTPFHLSFEFIASDSNETYDYVNNQELGVFIDNLFFTSQPIVNIDDNVLETRVLQVKVFPNPTKDIISFKLSDTIGDELFIELFNIKGQRMLKKKLDKETANTEFSINLEELSQTSVSGIYFYRLSDGHNEKAGKFLKLK